MEKKKASKQDKKNAGSHTPPDEGWDGGWVCPGWTGGRGADGSGPGRRRQSPPLKRWDCGVLLPGRGLDKRGVDEGLGNSLRCISLTMHKREFRAFYVLIFRYQLPPQPLFCH